MRLAVLALALTLPAASSALPAAAPSAAPASAPYPRLADGAGASRICSDLKVRPVRSPDTAEARRLGELPPGALTLTVLNRVGDCIEPMTVRQGYGSLDPRPGR